LAFLYTLSVQIQQVNTRLLIVRIKDHTVSAIVCKLPQCPQPVVTVENLIGVFFCRMPANDQRLILAGGFDVPDEFIKLRLAHPIRIIRMRAQIGDG
jgi:hypothetical protein